ncbi:hypothetical protein ACWFOB_22975, partial [Bacillus subtilis]
AAGDAVLARGDRRHAAARAVQLNLQAAPGPRSAGRGWFGDGTAPAAYGEGMTDWALAFLGEDLRGEGADTALAHLLAGQWYVPLEGVLPTLGGSARPRATTGATTEFAAPS